MQSLTATLKNKSLRKRIDGINFTLIQGHEELVNHSGQGLEYQKKSILWESMAKIGRVLKFGKVLSQQVKTKVTLDLNDSLGIYLEVFFKEIDLFVIIQFKGSFFVRDDAFICCQTTMLALMEHFDGIFRITTIDFAQDFLAPVFEIFPDPGIASNNYKYCFKFKFRKFIDSRVKEVIETGYELASSRYKIIVYDKIRENREAKNPEKKKYYDSLYAEYADSGVTRVEIRLKQELCKDLAPLFYDLPMSEGDFINAAIGRFYNKHKLRDRPSSSHDQDYRRWPVNSNWEYVFSPITQFQPKLLTSPNYLFTTPNTNVEKILNQLVEALAHSLPLKPKDYIRELISNFEFDSIFQKVDQRIRNRDSSKTHLDRIKKEILEKNKDLFDIDTNQLGMPITSPVERSDSKESNT